MKLCEPCRGFGRVRDDDKPFSYPSAPEDYPPTQGKICPTCRGTSRQPWMLLTTPLNDDERAAEKLEPRQGWGLIPRTDGHSYYGGDIDHSRIRRLDQAETDAAILRELYNHLVVPEREEFVAMFGPACVDDQAIQGRIFNEQRGGIHSDAIVRAYAWRAWGHRDQTWIRPRPPHEQPSLQQIPRRESGPLPAAPRGPRRHRVGSFLHQQGCEDPNCDGQCVR